MPQEWPSGSSVPVRDFVKRDPHHQPALIRAKSFYLLVVLCLNQVFQLG
jgi:hypothetical protein